MTPLATIPTFIMSSIPSTALEKWPAQWLVACLLLLLVSCAGPEPVSQEIQPSVPTETETVPVPPAPVPPAVAEPPEVAPSEIAVTAGEEGIWQRLAQAEDETYLVLLRHAIAPGTGDPANFQLEDCSTQRNLSEAGRQQAKEIGEAFRSRNVSVAKVLSSQWCRCLETAELMDIAPVEPFPAINSFFRNRSAAETQTNQVRDYVLNNQNQPGVIVMVTHQVNVTALTDIFPPSGTAVVLEIDDSTNGQLNVIGQILDSPLTL